MRLACAVAIPSQKIARGGAVLQSQALRLVLREWSRLKPPLSFLNAMKQFPLFTLVLVLCAAFGTLSPLRAATLFSNLGQTDDGDQWHEQHLPRRGIGVSDGSPRQHHHRIDRTRVQRRRRIPHLCGLPLRRQRIEYTGHPARHIYGCGQLDRRVSSPRISRSATQASVWPPTPGTGSPWPASRTPLRVPTRGATPPRTRKMRAASSRMALHRCAR